MTSKQVSGVLIINKHAGVSSHRIVSIMRRVFDTKQVGYTGTLDPMATGVLPILIGRAVKASEFLTAEDKRYTARMRLGVTTDTEDISGEVLSETAQVPPPEAVMTAAARFVGTIMQTPPMYSAIKVGGRKLVDLAREGRSIEREARERTVYTLTVTPAEDSPRSPDGHPYEYMLDVRCSKGTYIRTLCADIGAALGCGAVMCALCRTEAGGFSIAESVTIEEMDAMTDEEHYARLLPVERLFTRMPSVFLPPFFARLSRCGAEIYLRKLRCSYPVGTRVRLCDKDGFYGVGEVCAYPDGDAIKTLKLFVL